MAGQCSFRCPDNSSTVIPSMPGFLCWPSLVATPACSFPGCAYDFFHPLLASRTFCFALRQSDSVSSAKAMGLPLASSGKARRYWLFCRLLVVESAPRTHRFLYPLAGAVRAFAACAATRPSADFCGWVRTSCVPSVANSRPPADLPR